MVIAHIERLSNKNFRHFRELSSQIAGRKQRRKTAFDFRVPRHLQHRARQSPYKDIAGASKSEVVSWLKEDGNAPSAEGGSISDAIRHIAHVHHNVLARDMKEVRKGGSISGFLGDAGHMLKRGHEVFENFGGTKLKQAEILGDDLLDKIGLRKSRYSKLERNDDNRLHARLAQEVYKGHSSRSAIDGWEYDSGTDRYGVFKKGNQAIVHWRGTRPDADIIASGDLSADAKIAFGESDSMHGLEDDRQIVRDLLQSGYDTSVGGYSLGGGRALAVMNDPALYRRLGQNNHVISPGITAMNPHLKHLATLDKVHYTYSAFDDVSSALMNHATDNHHVDRSVQDGINAHTTFLKDLASQ
jgi:hypothetical protein